MSTPPPPLCILVAGVPRSGSTWAFNAARLLLRDAGVTLHAAWVADRVVDDPAPVHLIKAHQPAEVDFTPDIVLTTRRAPEACLASLIRMGWLAPERAAIRRAWAHHRALQAHWSAQSACEIGYDQIIGDPTPALARLARVLGLAPDTTRPARVAKALADLQAPRPEARGYNRETLLHPGHRRRGAPQPGPTPDQIRTIALG
ncbi:MAG: hypothetical protein CML02_00020 [Pseudooceanicola sp.]|nr:hypothetical protein [Pseudooceanicola sp.]